MATVINALQSNDATVDQIAAQNDGNRVTVCDSDECPCCEWLKFMTLYAHWIPEAGGCADSDDYIGDIQPLAWAPQSGDCDTWEYTVGGGGENLLECPDAPGPAKEVGHYIWLRCQGNNTWKLDICLQSAALSPATPTPGSGCTDNYTGLTPVVEDLLCRSPTDPTQPGYLYLDFGLIEHSICPEAGCGWRLIITTESAITPPNECPTCNDTTPTTIDVEISGMGHLDDPCPSCNLFNGTWTLILHPAPSLGELYENCVWRYNYGILCGQQWELWLTIFTVGGQTEITWTIVGSQSGGIASGKRTEGHTSVPCLDKYTIPNSFTSLPGQPCKTSPAQGIQAVINP